MLRTSVAMVAVLLAACSQGTTTCMADADCASLKCDTTTNVCIAADAGAPSDAGTMTPADSGSNLPPADGGSGSTDAGVEDAGSSSNSCMLSDGGVITAAQVPLEAGLHATLRYATSATVNTAGTAADGGTTWDLTSMLQSGMNVTVNLEAVTGQWFANSFPGATYATPLTQGSDLLGVFQVTSDSLLLLGVVSPTETSSTVTNLVYGTPIVVLQFPLSVGAQWQTTSTVTGETDGIPDTVASETYMMTVDESGTAVTPYGSFPVLRVNTLLYQDDVPYTRQFTFVTPCFGPIASITSEEYVTTAEFTEASEVQGLAQ